MPLAAILGLATAFCELVKVAIEKFAPDRHAKRVRNPLQKYVGKTIEEIARMRKDG